MNVTIRLPDTWSMEMVDHLLDFTNQLNNAIIEQYGTGLYEYWSRQCGMDKLNGNEEAIETEASQD